MAAALRLRAKGYAVTIHDRCDRLGGRAAVFEHEGFRDRYSSADGAGFSLQPLFRQSAFFRFHNRGEGIRDLYLVGAGTHPGAGLPGVVLSARVLDALVPDAAAREAA
ncbi:MAG: hypothetical protein ACLFTP_06600 [Rhodosalinus sp.]|uniref:hypothetical protein n=1 Tax=Rhodosalinus sp. TaxID=2047741 RepID=UPI0039787537